jgi:hypothetical protein
MNSHINNSSRATRASDREATYFQSVYDAATHLSASGINGLGSSRSVATEDLFSQFWTPGLLDRLQSPLTRYRE